MKERVISGLLGALHLLLLTYLGHYWVVFGVGVLVILGTAEFRRLAQAAGVRLPPVLQIAAALLYLCLVPAGDWLKHGCFGAPGLLGLTVVLLLFGYLVKELAQEDTQVALVKTGVGLLGLVYPGVLLSYIVLIRQLPEDGLLLTIFTYIVTWSCDTGAYFVGITCGRHKLAPKISPNKTIEGAVGGVLIGSAVGTVYLLLVGFPVLPWAVLALMGSIISLLGDLFESLLKRGANLKDSGDFLPGHGGVLDRFDSMMFVAPLIYYGALFFS